MIPHTWLIVAALMGVTGQPRAKMTNPFFAMDTCTKQRYPASDLTVDQQLDLLKALGYKGLSWTLGDPDELRAVVAGVRKRGLKLYAHYVGATLYRDRMELNPDIEATLDILKGTGAVVWLHIGSADFQRSSADGDAVAAPALRDLADRARARGLRVALYPHVGEWVERVEDALRLAGKVDRPNLGVTYNLCHSLKMGEEGRILELVRAARPRLFMVTINGADSGAADSGWDRLIQPLDRGSFDPAAFLRALRSIGYSGPVGLQGFGIRGDVRDNLARSMAAWQRLTTGLKNYWVTTPSIRRRISDSKRGGNADGQSCDWNQSGVRSPR